MALYDNSIGTTKNFDEGTIVFNNFKTIYDKDDMYIITKKHELKPKCIVDDHRNLGVQDKRYKYDLKKIDDEINIWIEERWNLGK